MNKALLIIFISLMHLGAIANPQKDIEYISNINGETLIAFRPSGLQFKELPSGEKIVSINNGTSLLIAGAPDLPKLTTSIIIPDEGEMDIAFNSLSFYEIDNIIIAPSKGNLKRTVNPSDIPFTYGPQYTQDAYFPNSILTTGTPYILRDYRGQTISICPFSYNPVTKKLIVYTELIVSITQKSKTGGANVFTRTDAKRIIEKEFDAIYKKHFINYSEITKLRYTPVSEEGSMLIICHDAFATDMQPFVSWKNKKGIQTDLVLKTVAGNTSADIKTYITNYYGTHPDLKYVLLVGDAAEIPASSTIYGDSDNNYGYLLGNDSYPELFIGRFSASTSTHVQTMVKRTLRYEQFPQLNATWYNNGIAIASNQGPGDDNEMDFEHQQNLRAQLLGFTYTNITENYDGSQGGLDAPGNPTSAMISNQINSGAGIITYTGHGSCYSFSSSGFSNNEVHLLTNTAEHPFIWSVACVNGDFVNYNECFAEAFLRAGTPAQPTGALATLMSTINQSWDPPMEGQDEMVNILVESAANNIKRTFGGLSMNGCMQMNDAYGNAGVEMTDTWTCFGDPSVMVYTATPIPMLVNHVSSIPVGTTSVVVSCNITDALVCLSQNGIILGKGYSNGTSATITIPAATAGIIDVTATAFNKMPYFGTISVGVSGINENNSHLLNIFPNPANELLNIAFVNNGENQKITIYNELGQIALNVLNENSYNNGSSFKQINIQSLPSGVYYIKLESESAVSTKYFVIQR